MKFDLLEKTENGYRLDGVDVAPSDDGYQSIVDYISESESASISSKQSRDLALLALTHDFGDGRIIQTRPKDDQNVKTAIELMTALNLPSIGWVMADNVKHPVTVEELQEALLAGQLAAMQIWSDYEP